MRWLMCAVAVLLFCPVTLAQRVRGGANAVTKGVQNLPYAINDSEGNQWFIQNGGWLQSRGNMPIYSQGALLMINQNQVGQNQNQARWDEKTGELVFENFNIPVPVQLTRRVLFRKEEGYVRYIDVFRNPQKQPQDVAVQIQSSLNYGVNAAQTVNDPKKKDLALAWVAQTGGNRCAVEVYAGKGAKLQPTINWPQGSNVVMAQFQLTVPGNSEVAIVHLHSTSATSDAGMQFVSSIKPAKLLAGVPGELRRAILNFTVNQSFIGDREVLRGELFDIVELRGGDAVSGTLQQKSWKLETFYGPVELASERVVGLINVGQFRPRQLLVTSDGEIFGGQLSTQTIDLQLSSGQVTQVPLSQISRVGYRKRAGEPEEWTFDKPMVALRSGDRMCVDTPEQPIEVLTRYGLLKLSPASIAAIVFQAEEHGVHEIVLTDGSRFAGLVSAGAFALKLSSTGQSITIPTSVISRLQVARLQETEEELPTFSLANEDSLVGTLTGQLKLDTAFDTITLNASEVRGLSRAPDAGLDVQVTLWDQTRLSGQLQDPLLQCALASGMTVAVPVGLIEKYEQPQPAPSSSMLDRIKAVVADLNAEDWKARDRAEAQLVSMGPSVVGVLKQLRESQPPEAQQRIDSVLKQLEGKPGGAP